MIDRKNNLVINTCSECGKEYNRMALDYCSEYPSGAENWADDDWYIHWTHRCPENKEQNHYGFVPCSQDNDGSNGCPENKEQIHNDFVGQEMADNHKQYKRYCVDFK